MEIVELYFISGKIVKGILERDTKISARGLRYCMVKPSTLRNILLDRAFRRNGKRIFSSADYYGFNRERFVANSEDPIRYFLNKEKEPAVIDFVRKQS